MTFATPQWLSCERWQVAPRVDELPRSGDLAVPFAQVVLQRSQHEYVVLKDSRVSWNPIGLPLPGAPGGSLLERADASEVFPNRSPTLQEATERRALRQSKVLRNVATLTDPPRKHGRELHPLTRDEVRAFLDGVRDDPREALYVTAIGTGLRQGELLALRWQDIDLEAGTLTVRHTLQRFTRELAEPKTERSRRTLHLPPRVTAALTAHRQRQAIVPLSGLVFATAGGAPLHSVNVTLALQRNLRRLGLPQRRFHDLRHTFATLAIEAGEDISVVSRALGHASVAITADVYIHITPAMKDRLAARMEAVLGA